MEDPNLMGYLDFLEYPGKIVGIATRYEILEEIARKIKARIRNKIMSLMMSWKSILSCMVEIPFLHLWKPMHARMMVDMIWIPIGTSFNCMGNIIVGSYTMVRTLLLA